MRPLARRMGAAGRGDIEPSDVVGNTIHESEDPGRDGQEELHAKAGVCCAWGAVPSRCKRSAIAAAAKTVNNWSGTIK